MTSATAWDRYRRYLESPPRTVVEWHDAPTGARGWLVLNSLRGGAAGGGTRMHSRVTRQEVVHLAKAMELKFAWCGPLIGGGKSGIAFDNEDPRRDEVLGRWFRAIRPYLATCYGTGGDVAVDEQRDVEPLCREMGLAHPQEGVLRGHMGLDDAGLARAVEALREGLRTPVTDGELGLPGGELNVSDLITGWGVARAAARAYETRGSSLEGRRVVVEGFGNVGASAAMYMARAGARIVGLLDAVNGLACPDGLDAAAVEDLVRRSVGRLIPEHRDRCSGGERERAYHVEADLFVPAAVSDSVGADRLQALAGAGVSTIVSGANHPFAEGGFGETEVHRAADERFRVVPDVIGSQGMARAFHHLMTRGAADPAEIAPPAIFRAVRESVEDAVDRVSEAAGPSGRGMMAAALEIALDRGEGEV